MPTQMYRILFLSLSIVGISKNILIICFSYKALYPFALIGSSDLVKIGNKFTRGRHYEWGTVSVENENHCDFLKLREMLLSTNLLDLVEQTHVKHYQTYRASRLREIGFNDPDDYEMNDDSTPRSITELFAYKVKMFNQEKEAKEIEIKEDFVRRVKEKENELKEAEREVETFFLIITLQKKNENPN